jgi:hypothetical protein
VPGRLPGIEPRFLEGRRNSAGVHGPVTAGRVSGRRVPPSGSHILVIFDLAFVVRNQSGPPPERF